ncbi:MAG: YaiO family outer membrane beta-barrel protein [Parabacteroides sp.]|nr:YaiO family outer membrane beta-barrel protein [Parabacteroides sp.]
MRNKVYSEYLAYKLEREGHEVHIENDGLSALEAMRGVRWELVLIGILLQYYNGLEILAEYRRHGGDARVIIITHVRNEQARRSAAKLGVSDFFALPIDTSLLMRKIMGIILLLFYLTMPLRAQDKKDGLLGAGANYFVEHVSEPARLNWQVVSVEALWGISPDSSSFRAMLIPRLNFAQRTGNGVSFFDQTALQAQMEAYLNFADKINIMALYGYSGSGKFPSHQALAELSYALGKGWGIIGGLQLTRWENTAITYRVGIEKYVGPFWVVVKPMLVTQKDEAFFAIQGNLRYYYTDRSDNYLSLGAFYGNSPEYASYLPDLKELLSLGSWGGYCGWQQQMGKHFFFRLGFLFRREEYRVGEWRNVVGGNTGLTYKF